MENQYLINLGLQIGLAIVAYLLIRQLRYHRDCITGTFKIFATIFILGVIFQVILFFAGILSYLF
jgi:hypothetical protein